jgi:hypothetical protein
MDMNRWLRYALSNLNDLNHSSQQKPIPLSRWPFLVWLNGNRMKERVMKLKIIGAVVALALAAGPAMAKRVISSPGRYAQSIYCATREAGNPYSKYCDYIAWSGWRRRGGWDSRLDDACWRNPGYVPSECFWR